MRTVIYSFCIASILVLFTVSGMTQFEGDSDGSTEGGGAAEIIVSEQNKPDATKAETEVKPRWKPVPTTTTLNYSELISGSWYWTWQLKPRQVEPNYYGNETWLAVFNTDGSYSEWLYNVETDATLDKSYQGRWKIVQNRQLYTEVMYVPFKISAKYWIQDLDATSVVLKFIDSQGGRRNIMFRTRFLLTRQSGGQPINEDTESTENLGS